LPSRHPLNSENAMSKKNNFGIFVDQSEMKEIVYDVKTLLEPLGLVKLFGESSKKHVVDEFQSFVTSPTPILQIASFNKLTKWIPHDATTQFIKFCAKLLFKDETKYLYKSAITYMTSHLSHHK
jgi:hypothetical protein